MILKPHTESEHTAKSDYEYYYPIRDSIALNNQYFIKIEKAYFLNKTNYPEFKIYFTSDTNNFYEPVFEIPKRDEESFPSLANRSQQILRYKKGFKQDKDTVSLHLNLKIRHDSIWSPSLRVDTIRFIKKVK